MKDLKYVGCERPHYQIREITEEDTTLYVSRTHNDSAHFIIDDQPTSIETVLDLHMQNTCSSISVHLLADNPRDIFAAIDLGCDFTYNGKSHDVSSLKYEQRILLKLQFSNVKNCNGLSRHYIERMVDKKGMLYTKKELAEHILATGAKPDQDILDNHFDEYIAEARARIERTVCIADDGLDVHYVDSILDVSVEEIMSKRSVIFATKMGDGKTTKIDESLRAAGPSMAVSHRCSITNSILAWATHYKEIHPGTEANIVCLNTVVNSIDKPQAIEHYRSKKIDLLVIEEATQVLENFVEGRFDSKTRGNNRESAFDHLMEVIRDAEHVILADAMANELLIEMLRDLRGDDITVYKSENQDLDKTIYLEEYEVADAMAQPHIYEKGGCAYVATDSKKYVNKHAKKGAKEGIKVLGITGDNIDDHRDIMRDPNLVSEHDSFLFSPVITSSFSLLWSGFTGRFGLYHGIFGPKNGVQQLCRDRLGKEFTVGLKRPMGYLPDSVDEILARDGVNRETASNFDLLTARIEADINFSKNNVVLAFPIIAEKQGFKVISRRTKKDEEEMQKAKSINASAAMIETHDHMRRLKAAAPAGEDIVEDFRESGESTEENTIAIEKRNLLRTCGTYMIEEKHYAAWQNGRLHKQVMNLEVATMIDQAKADKMNIDEKHKPARDRREFSNRHRITKMILDELNVNTAVSFNEESAFLTGSFTIEDANRLGEKLYAERKTVNRMKLINDLRARKEGQQMVFTSSARGLLRALGLQTTDGVTTTFTDEDGSEYQKNVYHVKAESIELMKEILLNRSGMSLTLK